MSSSAFGEKPGLCAGEAEEKILERRPVSDSERSERTFRTAL